MATICHLGFIGHVFGPLTETTSWSLLLCTFGWNGCNSFDNMEVFENVCWCHQKWGEISTEPPECTSFGRKTLWYAQNVMISPLVGPVGVPKGQKKKRKKPDSGKLANHWDYPRHRIKVPFVVVGGPWVIVISFKFYQNRFTGFPAIGGRKLPISLRWPLAYTAACTSVQAVIKWCQTWFSKEESRWRQQKISE